MRAARAVSWMAAVGVAFAVGAAGCSSCSEKPEKIPAPSRAVALEEQVEKASERAQLAGERAASEVRAKAPEGIEPTRIEQQAAVAKAQAQQREMQKGAADAAVVRSQQLIPFLPDRLGSYTAIDAVDAKDRGGPGPRMAAVRRTYEFGTRRASVQVVDALIAKTLQAPFDVTASINQQTDNGFKRSLRVKGTPAILEWRAREASSRIAVMAGERFLVDVRISRAQAGTDAQDIAEAFDLAALAAVRADVGGSKAK